MFTASRVPRSLPFIARSSTLSAASTSALRQGARTYASRKTGGKDAVKAGSKDAKHTPKVATSTLIPGSQRKAAGAEYEKAEEKMKAVIEKYRKDVAAMEQRASGRVTPAVLAPVRAQLKKDEKPVKLEEVATVGVREGTTLIVTVFEEQSLKAVEQGIYDAKIPHVIPQRVDSRTIKVPMPKATVESRNEMVQAAQKQAEDARVIIRKQQQASIKKGNYAKHSQELEEFQKLATQYLAEVDMVLAEVRKIASGGRK